MGLFNFAYLLCAQSGSRNLNTTFRSTSNPSDPLGLGLPAVGGNLMAHRMCANDGSSSGEGLSG